MSKTSPEERTIFSPERTANAGLDFLERTHTQTDEFVPSGLSSLDRDGRLLPLMPPDMLMIIARPGCGKTSFMAWWGRNRAIALVGTNRVVVTVTWETTVERMFLYGLAAETGISIEDMARGKLDDIQYPMAVEYANVYSTSSNMWYIGYSANHDSPGELPPLTIPFVSKALKHIVGLGYDIDVIFGDYLQEIPIYPKAESKVTGVMQCASQFKRLGFQFKCPAVLAAQAKRDVDSRELPIPKKDDCEWANAEKVADGVVSLARPSLYRNEGDLFGDVVVQGDCQLVFYCAKQRVGAANWGEWLYWDPRTNKFANMAKRDICL